MPMHRFALDDAAATYLYVSEVSGQRRSCGRPRERFWGYLGPVIHWVYFTPLRQNGAAWTQFVIWSSLIGCVMCVAGLVWGLWRFSPFARFRLKRVPSKTPYAGWMMWHHYAGLIFGVVTLDLDLQRPAVDGAVQLVPAPAGARVERDAATGGRVRLDRLSLDGMRPGGGDADRPSFEAKELEVMQFKGEPYWTALRAPSVEEADRWMHYGLIPRAPLPRLEQRYVSALRPASASFTRFPDEAMAEIARAAMPDVADAGLRLAARLRRLLLRFARQPLTAGAAGPLRRRLQHLDLPRSRARRHRPALGLDHPAATMAVPGSAQPRLSVPLLQASAVGHRGHRAEHWRHGVERHHAPAGMASVETTGPRDGRARRTMALGGVRGSGRDQGLAGLRPRRASARYRSLASPET